VNVRRLAAIDMYGTRGTIRRRRIILAEFLIGVVAMVAFGIWLVTSASDVSVRVLAAWMVGAGLNYAPLAAYAVALSRPGALDADLAGVDILAELRRYGIRQLWILYPCRSSCSPRARLSRVLASGDCQGTGTWSRRRRSAGSCRTTPSALPQWRQLVWSSRKARVAAAKTGELKIV
jgi:hypothetical protein